MRAPRWWPAWIRLGSWAHVLAADNSQIEKPAEVSVLRSRCRFDRAPDTARWIVTAAFDRVARALTMRDLGQYVLGTGGWRPNGPDVPWTAHHKTKLIGSDCSGFAISWCHKLVRHRPGFGRGDGKHPAYVEDDISVDSTIYDARHNQDLFYVVDGPPAPGDLLIMPGRYSPRGTRLAIGHVVLVVMTPLERNGWSDMLAIHCRGPNGKRPGVVVTDASVCARHDAKWLRVPDMQTQIVRRIEGAV